MRESESERRAECSRGENLRRKDEFFSRSNGVAALRIAVQTSHERERAGLKTFLRHTRYLFFVVNKETVSGQKKHKRKRRGRSLELNCSKNSFFLTRKKGAELFSNFFREDRKSWFRFSTVKKVCVCAICVSRSRGRKPCVCV